MATASGPTGYALGPPSNACSPTTVPTPAVDFFALGLILFEMLSGTRFFQQTTLAALAGAMLTFRPSEAIESLDAQANALFLPILEGLLAPTPSQRFNQAADRMESMARLMMDPSLTPEAHPLAAHKNAALSDVGPSVVATDTESPPSGHTPSPFIPTKKKNWPALALGALLVLVLGTLGLQQMTSLTKMVMDRTPAPSLMRSPLSREPWATTWGRSLS